MHFAQNPVRLRDGMAVRGTVTNADIDDYTQIVIDETWDASIVQLSAGRLDAGVDFLADERFVLYREHWSQRLHAVGCLDAGMIAFGVPRSTDKGTWWGRSVPEGRIPFCRAGMTLEQVNEPGEALTVLAMNEAEFLATFAALTGIDPDDFPCDGNFLVADPEAAAGLGMIWNGFLDAGAEMTLADIIAPLVDAMQLPVNSKHAEAASRGTLDLVLGVAEQREFRASVPEISRLLSVSRRTIECAFQRHLGESPSAYFRKRRLSRCRQALIDAEPGGTTVTAIALEHGFTEFGRFAGKYHSQFGELPSETLGRGSQEQSFAMRIRETQVS